MIHLNPITCLRNGKNGDGVDHRDERGEGKRGKKKLKRSNERKYIVGGVKKKIKAQQGGILGFP